MKDQVAGGGGSTEFDMASGVKGGEAKSFDGLDTCAVSIWPLDGVEMEEGEACEPSFGVDEDWDKGATEPLAEKWGLFGPGFPINGPEKACLLAFLASDAADGSSCGDERPDNGGDNLLGFGLLSPCLRIGCALKIIGPDNFSAGPGFSYLFLSKGDECHKLALLLRFGCLVCGASRFDFTGTEVSVLSGVGNT
nr:hypothetical protein Iba_chr13eCG4830 [Ipomoea batatas]